MSKIGSSILAVFLSIAFVSGETNGPNWWKNPTTLIVTDPEVTVPPAQNYAPANVGQLKHVASMAWLYLQTTLPEGAGFDLEDLWSEVPVEENYAPLNVGQLKAVAKPFYDRLHAEANNPWTHLHHIGYDPIQNLLDRGYAPLWPHNYPWNPGDPVTANYAPANVGQLKMVFSFAFPDITEEPFLTATCQQTPQGILLEWGDPVWGDYVYSWSIERATDPQGVFTEITNWSLWEGQNPWQIHRSYLDTLSIPSASGQQPQTCKETAILLTLNASGPNGLPLTFSIVVPPDPRQGSLGPIDSISNTAAQVWFTPAPGFCGQATFSFKVTALNSWPTDAVFYRLRYSYSESFQWRDSHYSNIVSPTGTCQGSALESSPATVTVNVGDPYPVPYCQNVMTEKGQPITLTMCGTDQCGDGLTFKVVQEPNYGVLENKTSIGPTCATITYTPTPGFEGTDTFSFITENCGFSSWSQTVTIRVVPGPVLTTECRRDRIVLRWTVPEWVEQAGFIHDFNIYRCETTSGTCNPTQLYQVVSDPSARRYVDTDVEENKSYCYQVSFRLRDSCGSPGSLEFHESPFSNTECNQVCAPETGPLDIAFIVDNTGSMGTEFLATMIEELETILDDIEAASTTGSTPDYRLALVTPDDDQVHVRLTFSANNRDDFESELNEPNFGKSGIGTPESTDECLNTVINALPASGRTNPRQDCTRPSGYPLPLQIGDFDTPFRTGTTVRRLVVLITDAPPGGFCDLMDTGNPTQAHLYALQAKNNCIRINAIQVAVSSGFDQNATPFMEDYAETSCGWYSQVPRSGVGIAEAILKMLYTAGACSCP
jgi:hypothetical protein